MHAAGGPNEPSNRQTAVWLPPVSCRPGMGILFSGPLHAIKIPYGAAQHCRYRQNIPRGLPRGGFNPETLDPSNPYELCKAQNTRSGMTLHSDFPCKNPSPTATF